MYPYALRFRHEVGEASEATVSGICWPPHDAARVNDEPEREKLDRSLSSADGRAFCRPGAPAPVRPCAGRSA